MSKFLYFVTQISIFKLIKAKQMNNSIHCDQENIDHFLDEDYDVYASEFTLNKFRDNSFFP